MLKISITKWMRELPLTIKIQSLISQLTRSVLKFSKVGRSLLPFTQKEEIRRLVSMILLLRKLLDRGLLVKSIWSSIIKLGISTQ